LTEVGERRSTGKAREVSHERTWASMGRARASLATRADDMKRKEDQDYTRKSAPNKPLRSKPRCRHGGAAAGARDRFRSRG
jgi:hypothetical protein